MLERQKNSNPQDLQDTIDTCRQLLSIPEIRGDRYKSAQYSYKLAAAIRSTPAYNPTEVIEILEETLKNLPFKEDPCGVHRQRLWVQKNILIKQVWITS
ncbi:hypothetical protein A4H97_06860 [Niastella yeongjuensis]|uniref:Uncharacterized protein n=1 Tax=Niastella yeongjuensis TaxID=354355 RepID=A0A1V9EM48_9BACT|nr:hypothetical protein [Niastella yeongjuensis]OQP47220.1 hypothetical protein A4H97_06860 [Niastella yeongjuensis]SEN74574.1 hypothetical protein SAMN05660816_01398 [Niastella yeongjuensis]